MRRSVAGMVVAGVLVVSGAQAAGADLRTEVRGQVQDACEVVALGAGTLTLRCTAGMHAPSEPRVLPGLPAGVRALGPLRLHSVTREPGGAQRMQYVALREGNPEEAGVRRFWFD